MGRDPDLDDRLVAAMAAELAAKDGMPWTSSCAPLSALQLAGLISVALRHRRRRRPRARADRALHEGPGGGARVAGRAGDPRGAPARRRTGRRSRGRCRRRRQRDAGGAAVVKGTLSPLSALREERPRGALPGVAGVRVRLVRPPDAARWAPPRGSASRTPRRRRKYGVSARAERPADAQPIAAGFGRRPESARPGYAPRSPPTSRRPRCRRRPRAPSSRRTWRTSSPWSAIARSTRFCRRRSTAVARGPAPAPLEEDRQHLVAQHRAARLQQRQGVFRLTPSPIWRWR